MYRVVLGEGLHVLFQAFLALLDQRRRERPEELLRREFGQLFGFRVQPPRIDQDTLGEQSYAPTEVPRS